MIMKNPVTDFAKCLIVSGTVSLPFIFSACHKSTDLKPEIFNDDTPPPPQRNTKG